LASRGFFLTLEGVDGCGKTTQLELLIDRLKAVGRDPVRVQEPGGTRIGLEIRKILLDDPNGTQTGQFLFTTERIRLTPNASILAA
jgi:dTMP kinase